MSERGWCVRARTPYPDPRAGRAIQVERTDERVVSQSVAIDRRTAPGYSTASLFSPGQAVFQRAAPS